MTKADDDGHVLSGASILIVDDEPGMRNFLSKTLGPRVKRVDEAASPEEATRRLDAAHFDLIILDNVMPGRSGLDWLAEQNRRGIFADVVLMTAYADLETAITALRAGVADFMLKPFRANQMIATVARTLERKLLRRDNTLMRRALDADSLHGQLLGNSSALSEVRHLLQTLASVQTPVLFTGESGTGKELAARHLHQISDRAERPFVPVNCATLAHDRLAEELFGRVDAAGQLKPGLLLLADGGTLFFDEVAQMPPALQTALLRVLEDKRLRPVGAEREIPLSLRFVFATNDDLDAAVAEGRFRADLFHRINVVRIAMPPLRDRSEDITELATLFMRRFAQDLGMPALDLNADTLLKLRRYDWPGNVRELRNMVERSVILGALPDAFSGGSTVTGAPAIENLEMVTQRHILHVLDLCQGNRAEAARRLGVSRKTIDRKMAQWEEG